MASASGRERRGRVGRRGGPRPRRRGAARAPAEVRRLVLPQGQAGPRRARHRGGGPGGRGGDRAAGPPRAAAGRPALPGQGGHEAGALLDRPRGRWRRREWLCAERRDRRGRRGSRSTRPVGGSPTSSTSRPSTEALEQPRKTRTLVVLRHSQARSRKAWRPDDRDRPLLATGRQQATKLVPALAAYDVRRLLSSSSTRCVQTLEPYAAATGRRLRTDQLLSEEDATRGGIRRLVTGLVDDLGDRPASAGGLVLCTHRPVLPWVFDAVGIDDPGLATGEMVVLHLRKGEVRACGAAPHRLSSRLDRRGSGGAAGPVHVMDVSRPLGRRQPCVPCSRRVHPAPRVRTPALPTFAS